MIPLEVCLCQHKRDPMALSIAVSHILCDVMEVEELLESPRVHCCGWCVPLRALFRIDMTPEPLKAPYIMTGYRLHMSSSECVSSIFQWHNETLNIWTHIVAAIIFCYLASISLVWNDIPFVFFLYHMAAFWCFFWSAVYHVFCCMSVDWNAYLLRMDIGGVFVLITVSCYPPCVYAFQCLPPFQYLYPIAITVLNLFGAFVLLAERYAAPEYRDLKAYALAGMASCAALPIVHIFYAFGFDHVVVNSLLVSIFRTYVLYGVGVWFFLSRWPERQWPGKFDYIGHSHQIWHTMVAVACYAHYHTSWEVFEAYKTFVEDAVHDGHSCEDWIAGNIAGLL